MHLGHAGLWQREAGTGGMLSPPAASMGQAGLWLSIVRLAGEVTPEPCPHHAGAKAGGEQDG